MGRIKFDRMICHLSKTWKILGLSSFDLCSDDYFDTYDFIKGFWKKWIVLRVPTVLKIISLFLVNNQVHLFYYSHLFKKITGMFWYSFSINKKIWTSKRCICIFNQSRSTENTQTCKKWLLAFYPLSPAFSHRVVFPGKTGNQFSFLVLKEIGDQP